MSKQIKRNILITVIHNNEKERIDYLFPILRSLNHRNINFQIIQIKDQIILNFGFFRILQFQFYYLYYVFLWQKYLRVNAILTFIKPIYSELRACISNFTKLNFYRKKVSIFNAITLKHLCALDYFLLTDNDLLVVLESDALIPNKKEFTESLYEVMEFETGENYFFCTLGSGFGENQLGIEQIKTEIIGKLRVYDKAFSNTGIAYMLNRESAMLFKGSLHGYPKRLPYLPFDWLINSILIKASKRGVRLLGVNLVKVPVIHGSRLGTTRSWQE